MSKCSICLEKDSKYGNYMLCTTCGNFFCGGCTKLLKDKKVEKCPLCRSLFFPGLEEVLSNLEKLHKKGDSENIEFVDSCLGFMYLKKGKLNEAKELFLPLSNKNLPGASYNLAEIYYNLEEYNLAKKYCLKSIKLPKSIYLLGKIYMIEGNNIYGEILQNISKRMNFKCHCMTGEAVR